MTTAMTGHVSRRFERVARIALEMREEMIRPPGRPDGVDHERVLVVGKDNRPQDVVEKLAFRLLKAFDDQSMRRCVLMVKRRPCGPVPQ